MNSILVAIDESARALDALDVSISTAAERDAELILAHVMSGGETEAGRALLEDAADVAAKGGVVPTTALLHGDAAEELVAFAELQDVDMIVLGARSVEPRAPAALGGVPRRVLQESRRPVLVVPAPVPQRKSARRAFARIGLGF